MKNSIRSEFDMLKKQDLFAGLGEAQLERVLEAGRRRKIEAEAYLFQEGDPAEILYVLLAGSARMSQVTPEGQHIILRYASPGEAVGLIAVLSEAIYPVTVQAVEVSQFIAWDREGMRRLMEQYPSIALNGMSILAARVREFQDRVRELSTEKVERRIARALLRLARQTGRKVEDGVLIDMPLSRQDLAEMTGTTLFTVSRTLSQWESRGLIKSKREQVLISFPHGLVMIAEDLPVGKLPPLDDE